MEITMFYTTLLAFSLVMEFDKRKEIKIKDLLNFRNELIRKYLEKNDEEDKINKYICSKKEEILDLLNEYSAFFSYNSGYIILNDDITLDDVFYAMDEQEEDNPILYYLAFDKKLFEVLNIRKIYEIKNIIEEVGYELEKEIENEYSNLNKDRIKRLLYNRFVFNVNVATNYGNYVENFLDIPLDDTLTQDNDIDYYCNSEYIKNNETYPIDLLKYEQSEFYGDITYETNTVTEVLEEDYQLAIFSNIPLYKKKFNMYFKSLYFYQMLMDTEEDFDEDYEELDINYDDIELIFYMTYIKKTDELFNNNKRLTKVKNRLLYLLDNVEYSLYDNTSFNYIYDKKVSNNYTIDDYSYYEETSKYFICEIFDNNCLKEEEKLIFISTYYELTKDKEIIKILNRYKNNSKYNNYYKYITGEDKGYTLKKTK